jgi:hypothetical protein
MPRPYWSEVLDHLGLVAGMFNELGIGEVLDRTMHHTPETRLVTVGTAVKGMILNGLGFVNQQLYLVPMFFRTYRRSASSPLGWRPSIYMMTRSDVPWISSIKSSLRRGPSGAPAPPQR